MASRNVVRVASHEWLRPLRLTCGHASLRRKKLRVLSRVTNHEG